MTIEQEILQRLRAMGLEEESLEPCMEHVKAEPLFRSGLKVFGQPASDWSDKARESFWQCAHSSALDYLEKKYHVEARKETANETQANG